MEKKQYKKPSIEEVVADNEVWLLAGSPDPLTVYGDADDTPISDKSLVW